MSVDRENGEKKEVALGTEEELASKEEPVQVLPSSVCPQGVVDSEEPEVEELPPGVSALDEVVPLEGGEA